MCLLEKPGWVWLRLSHYQSLDNSFFLVRDSMFLLLREIRNDGWLYACQGQLRAFVSSFVSSGLSMAAMVPLANAAGRKGKPVAAGPIESTHPETARALRQMQRDHRTRLLSTMIAGSDVTAIAVEDGVEGNVLVHYTSAAGSLTLAAGWLGSGRRRYIWVPLRPTLAWNVTEAEANATHAYISLLSMDEIAALAKDIHDGLTKLDQRHVIEEFLAPDPIPAGERLMVLERYKHLLGSHGWVMTMDATQTRRSLSRTPEAQDTETWPQAEREELARLEALMAQVLKGSRSTSRVLFQNK